jgi:hypothetical protein
MTETQGQVFRISTVPLGAQVKHNGRLLGTTTSAPLVTIWKPGDSITIEKPGFETETLIWSSLPSRSLTVTLKPVSSQSGQAKVTESGAAPGQQGRTQPKRPPQPKARGSEKTTFFRFLLAPRRLTALVAVPLLACFVLAGILYIVPEAPISEDQNFIVRTVSNVGLRLKSLSNTIGHIISDSFAYVTGR